MLATARPSILPCEFTDRLRHLGFVLGSTPLIGRVQERLRAMLARAVLLKDGVHILADRVEGLAPCADFECEPAFGKPHLDIGLEESGVWRRIGVLPDRREFNGFILDRMSPVICDRSDVTERVLF